MIFLLLYNVYLLVVLGYTSFPAPKKKLGAKKWRTIQKKAYQF
ncbi:hypothetical protein L21SP2_0584 [Salinispira pacifica]|uniref:Uncharacterized protein n=1 Tax=Salinispira pacifica TaxID=1307761 RepID=V5WDZ9_9SPIO|nr:hypothetical protein L21SP2_0584 [Salinispira pacifica]